MKKLFIVSLLIVLWQGVFAQCASYQSAFPPPYPSTYPCMSAFLSVPANSFCCTTAFDSWCITQLSSYCNNNPSPCFFEYCKSTGCSAKPMPYCPDPCPAYSTSNPMPGPNPPSIIDGILFEVIYFDGSCCMDGWDNFCTGAMDSIACLVCDDNIASTIDAAHPLLGCTHTPTPTVATPYVEVSAKVFLEGAYVTGSQGTMRTDLRTNNLLPFAQPFNVAPWSYNGTETFGSASAIPSNAVDWVLIELHDTEDPNCVVGRGAGILLSNGLVKGVPDATRNARVNGVMPNNNYYLVIRARNHAAIMSNMPLFCSTATPYDFSFGLEGAKGVNQQKLLESYNASGLLSYIYGMKAGDFNGDGYIKTTTNPVDSDFMIWKTNASSIRQYNKTDCSYDLMVTNKDFNLCVGNSGHISVSYTLPANPSISACALTCN